MDSKPNKKISNKLKALRILVAIMMVLSTLTVLGIITTNVAATQLGPADLSISVVGDSKKYAQPNQWVSFTLRITNANSNYDAWVNLTLSGGTTFPNTGSNWLSTLEKSNKIVVERGRSTDVRLDVRVGSETFNKTSKAGHVERVFIDGEYFDRGDSTFQAAGELYQTVDVQVLQKHAFEFKNKAGEPDPKKPNVARQVQFNFTLTNKGNGEDTFTFKVENAPGTPFLATTSVQAYKQTNVTLYVNNIPKDTEEGIHFVTVKAYSENTSLDERQAGVNIQIKPIYNLELASTEPLTKNVKPNKYVYYNFTLKNKGNAEDVVKTTSGIIGSAPGWDISVINPSPIYTIARNEVVDVKMRVTAPIEAIYPTTVQAYINISSTKDTKIFQYIDTIKTRVIQISDVEIDGDPQKSIDKSYMASFKLTVTNRGNGQDTFGMTVYGKFPTGELWNYGFEPTSVTLGPEGLGNDKKVVYFNVTGPSDAKYGSFNLIINATSKKNPSVKAQHSIKVQVGKFYNIDITRLASEKQSAYPGDIISFQIRGENTGNYKDTFTLDVEQPVGTETWTPEFDPELFLDLSPGSIETSLFTLTIDDDAPQGNYIFIIKCQSRTDPTKFDTSKLNVSVKKKYAVELTLPTTTKSADPGKTAIFKLTVQNKGTGSCDVTMDATMDIEYERYMNVEFSPSSFNLPSATSNSIITVKITPSPSNPLAPMNLTGIPITLNADITQKTGGPEASKTVKVKINQTYGVKLYSDTINIKPDPGSISYFNITITNNGNGLDSFGIAFSPVRSGWVVEPLDPNTKKPKYNTEQLKQNQKEKIMVKIKIPSNEKHISEKLIITVTSRGDSSQFKSETILINVDITRGVMFLELDNSSQVEPGGFVLFNVTVKNTGTIKDNYTLTLVQPIPDYIDFEIIPNKFLNVGVNEERTGFLNISVSDLDIESLPPEDSFYIKVTNDGNIVTKQRLYTIQITDVRGVRISASPNWQKGKPKETLTYNISVENTGTGNDRYALKILANPPYSGWARLKNFGDYTETLEPKEITYVEVAVDIPAKQEPGEGKIFLLAESYENPEKTHKINFTFTITQIFKLQITSEPNTQTVDPGENATYNLRIKNTGTGIDNVTLDAEKTTHKDSVFKVLFSIDYLTLKPGQTQSVVLTVVAVKEPEEGKLNPEIEVTVTSEEDTADTKASDIITIYLEINPTVDIELQADKIKKDVTPNLSGTQAEVEYQVTVWNRGLDKDSFDISEQNNHGFAVEISPTTTNKIDSGVSAIVTVKIKIDNKAPMSSLDYDTIITVTSRTNPDKSEIITLKTRIMQAYGVELQPLNSRIETNDVIVGDKRIVTFDVNLENIGTGDDAYKLELSGEYSKWASFSEASYLSLMSREKHTITITVKIPRETEIGEIPITLTALSRGDDTIYDDTEDEFDEVTLTVDVTQFYEVNMVSSEILKTGEPGDVIDFTITVTNRGNGQDSLEIKKKNYDPDWVWTISPVKFSLAGTGDEADKDQKEVTVSVDIPSDKDGKSGYYNISIYVHSVEAPENQKVQNKGEPILLTVRVDEVFDVDITLEYPTSSSEEKADPGRSIKYQAKIKNKGNTKDTYTISVSGSKSGWVTLERSSITILPYKSLKINFTVEIPNLDDVEPKEIEADDYPLTVKVTSENDPDQYDELDIRPEVNSEYKISLEYDELERDANDDAIIDVDPNEDPGYEKFSLTITNDGNDVDTVTLSARTSDWSIEFDSKPTGTYNLDIGVSRTIVVKVLPPDNAKNGETERITITAKSKDQQTKSSFILKPTVKTAEIRFGELKISGDALVGEKLKISLNVKNQGEVDAEDIKIKFYDNDDTIKEITIDRLGGGEEETISFSHKVKEGDHEIRAQTVDEWSGETPKKAESFTGKSEFIPSDLLWIIIIIAIIAVFIIGVVIASVTYSRSIPEDLREEIAMAKQAAKMGKSPEEIKEMRRKRLEKDTIDKKKSGFTPLPERELPGEEAEKTQKGMLGKAVRIKCPKCDKIQTVPSVKRPIEFSCTNCGMKLVLKK